MSNKFKINTIGVLIVAISFYFFFMTAKHNSLFSEIIPFAFDPYDAIGSFGVIISIILSIIAIVRTLLMYRTSSPTIEQKIFLARTQMAVAMAVLITTVADLITMARHPSMWFGKTGGNELLLLVVGMVVLATILGFFIHFSVREYLQANSHEWRRAAAISLVTIAILALYPEAIIQSTIGELITLAVGIVLLFTPMSALIVALISNDTKEVDGHIKPRWFSRSWVQWLAVVFSGMAIGAFSLIGESSEGKGGIPLPLRLIVSSIFIGAGTMGLVIAYAFLRKPLGLA